PYVISSPITFKILGTEFNLAVLTYQKEFAERMVAKPGTSEYGRLSVGVYYRASVELLETIPPSAFYPEPKVYSTIVRLRPKTPPFKVIDEKFFFNVVRALFQHRRKKVNNALLDSFHEIAPATKWPKQKIKTFLEETVKLNTRVFLLKPEEMGNLSNVLYNSLKTTLTN
ncbi:MAG: 16S ribosomal RNA methyltransferase A, partial [Euryarchaeota archaeon]|nr:16S ribosomal RNA methyltransferase A [Euryarchaeota archaeon]